MSNKQNNDDRKMPSIDTSRVSAYTAREQQSLERLKKKVGHAENSDKRKSNLKTILAILLILLLLSLIVVFLILIGNNKLSEERDYEIRVSMAIENKSVLSFITDSGQEQLREIYPGDKIPLKAYVRNSSNYAGDPDSNSATAPKAIFVRFKVFLILDYEERYDILKPTMRTFWYKYNRAIEEELTVGRPIVEDDHWFYYVGSLPFIQSEELFSEIEFDGEILTCDDGGKYGQIQVIVESTEADLNSIVTNAIWPTAPEGWKKELIKALQ